MTYNIMSCQGEGWTMSVLGDCSFAWFSFAIILFLCLICKRQAEDGFLSGTGFNVISAFILGIGANVLVTALIGDARWSLLAGIIGVAVGGFVVGMFFDMSGGGDGE